ncbi:MAG: tRNA 4-thiouridine(8) synthase ThiI [Pseudomonadota bacterium]
MKALSVFSGGLDSLLAATLIREQGIDVLALFFETPFFTSERAVRSATSLGLPIKIIDITESHLKMLKKPKHGYGQNMNPCIDCHTLMIRKAGERLEEEGAGFIITGEVVGQRPMSQNIKALSMVESESGYKGLILRPLSAKRLPVTIPEEKGWVDRDKLMGYSGRSRKPQMALAKILNIHDYPSPAGGCLLTDGVFSRRLKDLFSSRPNAEVREIELLKLGRHFRIDPNAKLVVGRNKEENQAIRALFREMDLMVIPVSVPGPTVLALGTLSPEIEAFALSLAVSYSDAGETDIVEVRLLEKGVERVVRAKGRAGKEAYQGYMI